MSSLPKKIARRMLRVLGMKPDPWEVHYAAERKLFKHTLRQRPWLIDGVPEREATADELDVVEYDLLRYAHAIDKGLRLEEHRVGFGKEKTRCVVRMMQYLKSRGGGSRQVIGWAVGILRSYRQMLESDMRDPLLSDEQSESLTSWMRELDEALREFQDLECLEVRAPVHQGLSAAYFERRSIRKWSDRPVVVSTLRTLVEAAAWAPASCNRHPQKLMFLRDERLKNLALSVAAGSAGFADRSPVILLLLSDVRAYYAPHERHLAYFDAALAAQNLALAAHELGLGTVMLSCACEDVTREETLRAELRIPDWFAVVAAIAIGYPDEMAACEPSVRQPIDRMMFLDGFAVCDEVQGATR